MPRLAGLSWLAVVALVMAAPAHADPDCPNGRIVTQDCGSDNCGDVHVRCYSPRDLPVPPWPPVEVQLGVGIGI